MSKIIVSEKDLTISNEVDITANVVFVPGMASSIAEDKPTLFTSVSQFTQKYGTEPYKFKSDQLVDNEIVIGANEYEKSYIYAIELLNVGIPVLFQNILSTYSDNTIDDSGLLANYYTLLKTGGVLGSKIFEESNGTIINVGNAEKDNDIYKVTQNTNIGATQNKDGTYNILGYLVPQSADPELGMPNNKYNFAVGFKFSDLESVPEDTQVTVSVSPGTTFTYTKAEAFESDDTLVSVLNVTNNSTVTISVNFGDDDIREYVFKFSNAEITNTLPTKIPANSIYSIILDRWTYNVKFISTGGYPTLIDSSVVDLLQTMTMAAAVRGDATALIDNPIQEGIYKTFNKINTKISADLDPENVTEKQKYSIKGGDTNKCNLIFTLNKKRLEESTLKYATIIGPQGTYSVRNSILTLLGIETIVLPGSFGYLLSLANSIETLNSPDYIAIAGVTRGKVPELNQLTIETTGAEADAVQVRPAKVGSDGVGVISLNPIVFVQNYGYCIWGNRTLFPNPSKDLAASSFLNIRIVSADVKKLVYAICQKLTFETNNLELWLKFKSELEPLLDEMVANGVLVQDGEHQPYKLTRVLDNEKATMSVNITLTTEYAVEDFNIVIGLTDSTVEIAE